MNSLGKYLLLFFTLLLSPYVNALECPAALRQTALRKITSSACESCVTELVSALSKEGDQVAVMVNFVSEHPFSVKVERQFKQKADKSGVEVLDDLTTFDSVGNPLLSSTKKILTFVLRGKKVDVSKIVLEFSTEKIFLAHFEVLNSLPQRFPTSVAFISSTDFGTKEVLLKTAMEEARSGLVIVNDAETGQFFAVVNDDGIRDLPEAEREDFSIVKMNLESFIERLPSYERGVLSGKTVFVIPGSDPKMYSYVLSLDRLSSIERERSIIGDFAKSLIPEQEESVAKPVSYAKKNSARVEVDSHVNNLSKQLENIRTVGTSDFITNRVKIMKRGGAMDLNFNKPAVTLMSYSAPYFVGFSPEAIKAMPLQDAITLYKKAARIPEDQDISKDIRNFLANYKKDDLKKGSFDFHSISEINILSGYKILDKSHRRFKPLITVNIKGDDKVDDVLLLLPIKSPEGI